MLKSLGLRYDALQDRIVLRLVLQDGDDAPPRERRLHVTRRVCAAWRQDLQAMLEQSADVPPRMDRASRAAVSAVHHQSVAAQARVKAERAAPEAEAGPAVLVRRVLGGRRKKDGRWVLRFELVGAPAFTLVLSQTSLHGLFDALAQRVAAAGWNLPLLPVERSAAAAPAADTPLH